jgi:hypothetical protein
MKKLIMTMAAVSVLAMAAPATAQYASGNFDARINQLQANLQAGVQSGRITRGEAVQLRDRLRQLTQLERQYSRDGLTRAERNELQQRIQTLRQQIRAAERNGDNRPRYDNDDNDYRNGHDCPPGLAKKNNGCVPPGQVGRVGSRYDGDWGRVPSQWQNQYRDTNRYMYRYDNGRIYQIDRRTGNVVRVTERR